MYHIKKRKGSARRRLWTRLLAVLLCVLTVLPVFAAVVTADDEEETHTAPIKPPDPTKPAASGQDMQNTYVLAVSTGYCTGEPILYFGVRYVDADGITRTAFVFPERNSLRAGYEKASKISKPDDRIRQTYNVTGYTPDCKYIPDKAMGRNSYDTYLFEPHYEIKTVIGVDIFMQHGDTSRESMLTPGEKRKNEWTCNGISVYKVDTLYGVDMAGWVSTSYFINFDGTLLAALDMMGRDCIDFSLNETDKLIRITPESRVGGYTLKTTFDDPSYSVDDTMRELVFRMDIADIYEGGIEALANEFDDKQAALADMHLLETLAIEFSYLDLTGTNRTLMLPVITSFVGWVTAVDESLGGTPFIGVAQQGDTLLFGALVPGFVEMTGFTLHYGTQAGALTGISPDIVSRRTTRADRMKSDKLSYTGFSIFDAGSVRCDVYADDAVLRCTTDGTPLYMYRSSSANGQSIDPETSRDLFGGFTSMEEGGSSSTTLLPDVTEHQYIVEITTDQLDMASTTDKLFATFTYISKDGMEKTADRISLVNASRDFIGSWPGQDGEDVTYRRGLSSGQTLRFALTYTDVRYFTAVELSVDESQMKDDWQMSSIAIYETDSVSKRHAKWMTEEEREADETAGLPVTDRLIWRDFDNKQPVQYCNKKILFNENLQRIRIVFDGTGGGTTEETDIDWEQYKDAMSQNEAMQDFGFTKARSRYIVTVSVKSNTNGNVSDLYGDCGSNNKFYFQLIFEKGTSGYVQANQQLTSDGFRAGMDEQFEIAVNGNYGDLRAVRIIPDDTVDKDYAYDKLNVDSILVSEKTNDNVSRSWRISNVGWINIDFRDSGDSTVAMTKLRKEYEISRSYSVSERGYDVNLLFSLTVGEYKTSSRYVGNLTATVGYLTADNQYEEVDVDVARAIAEYAERTPSVDQSGSSSSEIGVNGKKKCLIEPDYMMRPGKVDRFNVTLPNVHKILTVTLHIAPTKASSTFTVAYIGVYQTEGEGTLLINANGEYQRDYVCSAVCANKDSEYRLVEALVDGYGNGIAMDIPFDMTDNAINVNTERWEAVINREPLGDDDTLNIYVFPSDDVNTKALPVVDAAVQYLSRNVDRSFQAKVSDFKFSSEKNMYYSLGVNTSGISVLRSLTLRSDEALHIDHAIIQQVRYGVVVNTYYLRFNRDDIEYQSTASPDVSGDSRKEQQVVSLQFSSGTDYVALIPDETDLAVMIRYTSVNDLSPIEYDSAYIFLTDQQINDISAGKRVDVVFDSMYVEDIIGVYVAAIGQYNARIDTTVVRTYTVEKDGTKTCTGQYLSDSAIAVTRSKQGTGMTGCELTSLEIDFNPNAFVENDTQAPDSVSAVIMVVTDKGIETTVTVKNLYDYVISGDFTPGTATKTVMLLRDVVSVRGFVIEPHSTDPNHPGTLDVGGIYAEWNSSAESKHAYRAVQGQIREGDPCLINANTVSVWVQPEIILTDGSLHETLERIENGGTAYAEMDAGCSLRLPGGIVNAIPGYESCVVGAAPDSGAAVGLPEDAVTEETGAYVFRPPVHTGTEDAVYVLTVAALEDPAVFLTIVVTVHPGAAEESETTDEP